MNYQWYPGHMTKAMRSMQEDIKLVDLVVEVVDARIPISSRNPEIDTLAEKKARLILLNKADLADKIYNDKCQTDRKRRLNTIEKKNTMRSYLENKIKDEVNEINKLNSKMKNYRSQSIELLNRINRIFNHKESKFLYNCI